MRSFVNKMRPMDTKEQADIKELAQIAVASLGYGKSTKFRKETLTLRYYPATNRSDKRMPMVAVGHNRQMKRWPSC